MKTLITLIATVAFTFFNSVSFSAEKPEPKKYINVESIIDHYIAATTQGETEYLKSIFSQDFKLTSPSNSNSKPFTKSEIIKHPQSLKNVKLLCETNYTFVEKNNNSSIVKVTSTFKDFERVDYLTICNSELGWKVCDVIVAYPEK